MIVDDDESWSRAVRRLFRDAHRVDCVPSVEEALRALDRAPYDTIVADVVMPDASGLDLLRHVRERDPQLPVILVTGKPSVAAAAEAVARGAFRYLLKPIDPDVLRAAVGEGLRMRESTRLDIAPVTHPARRALEDAFANARRTLSIAFQPIVAVETRRAIGFEALMRSTEPTLPNPLAVLEAAEQLSLLHVLGRDVRSLVAHQMGSAPAGLSMFVNVHPADLTDDELFDANAPLSRHARRVVLEITERASLDTLPDLELRVQSLRSLGFRIAIDDLGAGYAGLGYFARVQPEFAKVDMSLIRGIDRDTIRQRIVLSIATLAAALGMEVIAEGVETPEELDAVVKLGCAYVQGYALARPGPPFPEPRWQVQHGGPLPGD